MTERSEKKLGMTDGVVLCVSYQLVPEVCLPDDVLELHSVNSVMS